MWRSSQRSMAKARKWKIKQTLDLQEEGAGVARTGLLWGAANARSMGQRTLHGPYGRPSRAGRGAPDNLHDIDAAIKTNGWPLGHAQDRCCSQGAAGVGRCCECRGRQGGLRQRRTMQRPRNIPPLETAPRPRCITPERDQALLLVKSSENINEGFPAQSLSGQNEPVNKNT